MNLNQFHGLCSDYSVALEQYIAEIRRTSDLLVSCKAHPQEHDQRVEFQAQRVRENDASDEYRDLRARLFCAARSGYTNFDLTQTVIP